MKDLELFPFSMDPEAYNLSIHEHNLSLLLLTLFQKRPVWYIDRFLELMLQEEEDPRAEGVDVPGQKLEFYEDCLDSFRDILRKEAQSSGSRETAQFALSCFRQSAAEILSGKRPDLSNLDQINCQRIASEPSAEYERFLSDWRMELYRA